MLENTFKDHSKAGVGLTTLGVAILIMVGKWLGVDVLEADAVQFVQYVTGVVGLVLAYWGQFTRKDITGFVGRVKSE